MMMSKHVNRQSNLTVKWECRQVKSLTQLTLHMLPFIMGTVRVKTHSGDIALFVLTNVRVQ
jgi:hypothetical protein